MRLHSLFLATAAFVASLTARSLPAQDRACPADSQLAGITARGRALAAHDRAAWYATDAFLATKPDTAGLESYVVVQEGEDWRVHFGRLDTASAAFAVGYDVRRAGADSVHDGFVATRVRPFRRESGAVAGAAAALKTGRATFGPLQRPYVFSALPASGGEWWVYATPAVTREGVWPLGGDVRYRVSADGRRVLATRQLHRTILEWSPPRDSSGNAPVSGFHSAILDVVPEDTDVFHVLQRRPQVPEMVVTDGWVFRIDTNGEIRCLGDRRKVLGGEK